MKEYIVEEKQVGRIFMYEHRQALIRCKDCKHFNNGYCIYNEISATPEWYCADGERRDDDG